MNSSPKRQEPKSSRGAKRGPRANDDDFTYEEVSVKDNWTLGGDEEDLDETMRAVQKRVPAMSAPLTSRDPDHLEALDDFIRNNLRRMGMMDTLDSFQTEWYEMVQRGQVDDGVVPDVHAENQRLQNALKTMQLEGEEYKMEASRFSDVLLKVMRARDHHRLQYERVLREKNRLIQNMKKLKAQSESYEPELKRMNEKYEAVVRQTAVLSFEKDKAKRLNATRNSTRPRSDESERKQIPP